MSASDVMTRQVKTVGPATTVMEAVSLMRATGHSALPVVDEQGRVLGMLTDANLLNRCLPEYVQQVGDLYSTAEFPPFNELVRALAPLPVAQVMEQEPALGEPGTPVTEIAALMTTHHVRHVPIIDDDRLVGIVGAQDVLDRISQAGRGGGAP